MKSWPSHDNERFAYSSSAAPWYAGGNDIISFIWQAYSNAMRDNRRKRINLRPESNTGRGAAWLASAWRGKM